MKINPISLFKWLYGAIGLKHPLSSSFLMMAIGGGLALMFWFYVGDQYKKDLSQQRPTVAPTSVSTGPATATGQGSVANTGNDNNISTDGTTAPKKVEKP